MHRSYLGGWAVAHPLTHISHFFHPQRRNFDETLSRCCRDLLQLSQSLSATHDVRNRMIGTDQNILSCKFLSVFIFVIFITILTKKCSKRFETIDLTVLTNAHEISMENVYIPQENEKIKLFFHWRSATHNSSLNVEI